MTALEGVATDQTLPAADHQSPANKRRRWIIAAAGVTAIAGAVAIYLDYSSFTRETDRYLGLSFDDTRQEAMYRLGYPDAVLGPLEKDSVGVSQRIYFTAADRGDASTKLPDNAKIESYSEWFWDGGKDNQISRTVGFKRDGKIESIHCYKIDMTSAATCPPVYGIGPGTSEDELVQRLGKGTHTSYNGVAKYRRYDGLGVDFALEKGRVYGISVGHHDKPVQSEGWMYIESRAPTLLRPQIRDLARKS